MDRLKRPFAAAVESVMQWARYSGVYRYSVVSCDFDAQTIDAVPLNKTMPNVTRAPMVTPGMRIEIAQGAIVLIGFAECDPTLAYVAQYSQDPGAVLRVELLGGTTPLALQGMEISITAAQISTAGMTSPSGAVTVTNTLKGTITGGSSTMKGLA